MTYANWREQAQRTIDAAEIAHDIEQDSDELGEDNFESVGRQLLFGAPASERETRIMAAVLSVTRAYDRNGLRGLATACAAIPDDIAADCHAPIRRAILGR